MSKETHARHRDKLGAIARELDAMSDWELERGCAASLGFDDDRRWIANRILEGAICRTRARDRPLDTGDSGRDVRDRTA